MTTPRFALPLMSTASREKEAIFNELAIIADSLIQLSVLSITINDPALASETNGSVYIVASGATGLWTGQDDNIAFYYNGWQFIPASPGMRAFDQDTGNYYRRTSLNTWIQEAVSSVSILSDLTDVGAAAPSTGEALVFNGTIWEPGEPTVTPPAMSDISDVDDTNRADNRILVYNNVSGNHEYIDFPVDILAIDDLTDVNTTGKATGQYLQWNGSTWVAAFVTPPAQNLNDIADVDTSGASNGDFLVFNGAIWLPSATSPTTTFQANTDTPNDYGGNAGRLVVVNGGENGLEYVDAATVLGAQTQTGFALGTDPVVQGGCRLVRSTPQLIPPTTATTMQWEAKSFDDLLFADLITNDTRITIPADITRVRLTAGYDNPGASGVNLQLTILKNGVDVVAAGDANFVVNGPRVVIDTGLLDVTPGDYFEVQVYHDGGVNIDQSFLSTFFTVENRTPVSVPVIFSGYVPVLSDPSTAIAPHIATVDEQFPTDFATSLFRVFTAPDADTTLLLKKNGITVGSVTFLNGQTDGTVSTDTGGGSQPVNMVVGDVLTIETDASPNAVISGLHFSAVATRL